MDRSTVGFVLVLALYAISVAAVVWVEWRAYRAAGRRRERLHAQAAERAGMERTGMERAGMERSEPGQRQPAHATAHAIEAVHPPALSDGRTAASPVRTTGGTMLRDEEIQKNVLEQFKWDTRIRPAEIGVAVKDGVVTLMGAVDSYTKKWRAEQAALRVSGVRAVANQVQVALPSAGVRSDEEIARAARQVLQLATDIPDTVKVVVEGGWITLEGEVEWYFQKEAAERKVQDLPGVNGVYNLLEIKPKTHPEDLKRRIEEALVRSAETDAKNIQVEVRDGKVVLRGQVHSWYEKEEARREAWLAPGVREVVDELQIRL